MNTQKLKNALLAKYKTLNDCIIVNYNYDYSTLKRALGKAGARIFENILQKYENPKVGIGGGSTLYSLIETLPFRPRVIRIFPTSIIGRGPEVNHIDSTFLTTLLFLKSRPLAKAFVVNSPPLPKDNKDAMAFLQSMKDIDEVNWLVNAMQNVDAAFIGVGAAIPTGDFDDEMNKLGITFQVLKAKNIVGGINYNWFTQAGDQLESPLITLSIESLRSLAKNPHKSIVLIGGGEHKIHAIGVAVRTGMVNILVTDQSTVKFLLK